MRKTSLAINAWIVLAAAILVWIGVGLFAFEVVRMQNERTAYVYEIAAANLQEGQAAQLHALARETVIERGTLSQIANIDVLSAVNVIESVRSGAAKLSVTGAQAEKSIPGKAGNVINVASLNLHTEGSFADVMRVAQMVEVLPLATSVQTINITRSPIDETGKAAAAQWSLDVRLRFFTTTPLST